MQIEPQQHKNATSSDFLQVSRFRSLYQQQQQLKTSGFWKRAVIYEDKSIKSLLLYRTLQNAAIM
jgi:hypothetical protein